MAGTDTLNTWRSLLGGRGFKYMEGKVHYMDHNTPTHPDGSYHQRDDTSIGGKMYLPCIGSGLTYVDVRCKTNVITYHGDLESD